MAKPNNKIEPRLLKGFRDYGLNEQAARQETFRKIQSVFERFGFLPLSTPVLEYKEILMGKYGDDEKLVYSFTDNGDREVAMRYDLTVPLARYVAQNQGQLSFPFKRYQIAPVWRADNPQKGRLREFYQCDVDAVGTDSALADAEVIACLAQGLEAAGVSDYVIKLNNREVFKGLSAEAVRSIDKVDKIGVDSVIAEMKDKGVSSEEIKIAQDLLGGSSSSIPESVKGVMSLLAEFELQGEVRFDASIARGLDYYTGTVFEIYLNSQPEFGSVCSGGRYDGLVDQFSNQSLPAVGGSIGVDRLLQALAEKENTEQAPPIKVLVLNLDDNLSKEYVKFAGVLRAANINTELYYESAKLDKQFKYAESKQIPYAAIIGEAEAKAGTVQLKNLKERTQEEINISDLPAKLND